MKPRLLWKLLAIQVPGIIVAIALIWVAIDYLAADYFMSLMERYQVSPRETHAMFLEAIHRYLISASLLALLLGFCFSYLLTRRAIGPLTQMIAVTRAVAHGDYSTRVSARSSDEIGSLAAAFNRMADNLEEVEQMRRILIANAAHELRTPLTNIRGYLEALKDGVVPPAAAQLEMLHNEALRLVLLTDSLFELARADAAHLKLRLACVRLSPLVDEVMELSAPRIEERRLRVTRSIDDEAETVTADPERLRQVLRNLADNAVTYAGEGGWIRVRATRHAEGVKVEFANDGTPIAAEDLPFVFERFYRAEKSRSRGLGGAGIGLAIVKELVLAHGGEVGANSEDGCTRIWFVLPDVH